MPRILMLDGTEARKTLPAVMANADGCGEQFLPLDWRQGNDDALNGVTVESKHTI